MVRNIIPRVVCSAEQPEFRRNKPIVPAIFVFPGIIFFVGNFQSYIHFLTLVANHLALFASGGILQLCVVACVHQAAAHPPELALPGHGKQRPVKEGMVLPEVLLLPVTSHLCLLMLRLDQLDIQVLGPTVKW